MWARYALSTLPLRVRNNCAAGHCINSQCCTTRVGLDEASPTYALRAVEAALGRLAKREMLGMQMGDVRATSADISRLEAWVGFRPQTQVEEGIAKFVAWYRAYYRV